ncbi:MAG: DUF1203 domain-containing protein [Methylobacterium sp.]|jgi:hypothetical protein|nr:DUF1203 domain-containing protein [Methylobacterium sp.]
MRTDDAEGMLLEADLAAKDQLVALTRASLARPDMAHADFYSARRGCFFCRVRRICPPKRRKPALRRAFPNSDPRADHGFWI